ncbi:hypothetical protein BCV70DRAFT_84402 [Testicularia cyperi]|uniref:Uncharacterized protein n=1 Tax=Testicularia cyperi TaxID=1882483 RepID=A0A317XRF4_9BASI|nr:hypothetical protein BCV70DRAFT_84402 [Testicularia cyperi]
MAHAARYVRSREARSILAASIICSQLHFSPIHSRPLSQLYHQVQYNAQRSFRLVSCASRSHWSRTVAFTVRFVLIDKVALHPSQERVRTCTCPSSPFCCPPAFSSILLPGSQSVNVSIEYFEQLLVMQGSAASRLVVQRSERIFALAGPGRCCLCLQLCIYRSRCSSLQPSSQSLRSLAILRLLRLSASQRIDFRGLLAPGGCD